MTEENYKNYLNRLRFMKCLTKGYLPTEKETYIKRSKKSEL